MLKIQLENTILNRWKKFILRHAWNKDNLLALANRFASDHNNGSINALALRDFCLAGHNLLSNPAEIDLLGSPADMDLDNYRLVD